MDIEESIKRIIEQTGLPREEIRKRMDEEIASLSGLIDDESAIIIVTKKLGIDLKDNIQAAPFVPDQSITSLRPNMNASIVGRIVEIGELRNYNRKDGGTGSFFSFLIQDSTGKIRIVAWSGTEILNDTGFARNEIVRIVNGLVKLGKNGIIEVHVGNKSRIQTNPDNVDFNLIPAVQANTVVYTPVKDISLNSPDFNVQGVVSGVYPPKEYQKKAGGTGKRASILLRDSTDSIFITFWDQNTEKMANLKEGTEVQITRLIPRKNYSNPAKMDLTASFQTEINVLGQKPVEVSTTNVNIKDVIEKGTPGIIEAVVQSLEDIRQVSLKDGTTKEIQSFIISDKSGAIRVNLWGDTIERNLKVGDSISISDGFCKKNPFSNQPELSLGKKGRMQKINKNIEAIKDISALTIQKANFEPHSDESLPIEKISQIKEERSYKIRGAVVREFKKITIYDACPACNRKSENCSCTKKSDPVPRVILNGIFDDESDSIRVTWIGKQAELILKDSAVKIKEYLNSGQIDEYLKQKSANLVGKEMTLSGRAKFSQYNNSYELTISGFEEIDPEIDSKRLIELLNTN
jgi:replication factor A1